MELSTVGSVTAYVKSVKTSGNVQNNIDAGFSNSRSAKDTAAFSARARAVARLKRAQPAAEEIIGKIGVIKESAERQCAENSALRKVQPTVEEIAEKINAMKESAEKRCAENSALRKAQPTVEEIAEKINKMKESAEKQCAENSALRKAQPTVEEIAEKINAMKASAERQCAENSAPKKTDTADTTAVTKPDDKTANKTIAEMVKEQMEKLDNFLAQREYDKANDSKLGNIKAKMRSGMNLTPSEQQYLAAKDPESYSCFQQIESARKMYRCSLNACRTKDEVTAMRLSNALSALSAYKKAIRQGGDGSAVAGLNAALDREIRDFSGSANYRRLPTVAECNKFDRDLAKAKRYEREKRLAEKKKLEAKRKKKLAERKLAAKRAKLKKTPGDGKQTVAQVMSSPTARKVLASRANRSYCGCADIGSYNGVSKLYSKA